MYNGKIICDMFPFSEEFDILDIRLNELDEIVDYFVIVESCYTQSRLAKTYNFQLNSERYSKFADKIIYIKQDKLVPGVGWEAEHYQRRGVICGLNQLVKIKAIDSTSYFILSDVDEIPSAETVRKAIDSNMDLGVVNHFFGSYYLNWISNFRYPWGWYGSVIGKISVLESVDVQWLRTNKDSLSKFGGIGEGWHFSNILVNGFDSLYNKWVTRIEPTKKDHLLGEDNINRLRRLFNKIVLQDGYFFFCDDPENRSIKMDQMDIALLPRFVKNDLPRWRNLIR